LKIDASPRTHCKQGAERFSVDGFGIASKLRNLLVVNTVLLGAVSALPEVPIKRESFEGAIAGRLKREIHQVEPAKAFRRVVTACYCVNFISLNDAS